MSLFIGHDKIAFSYFNLNILVSSTKNGNYVELLKVTRSEFLVYLTNLYLRQINILEH